MFLEGMQPTIIVLMGVAGAGKTTIGRRLAQELGWHFCDGDEFHSQANIDKIRSGHPLDDEDRRPWLARIRESIVNWIRDDRRVVLASSLLKAKYRAAVLNGVRDRVTMVYLDADPPVLRSRLLNRPGHFMGEALLESQLAILEVPSEALHVDASLPPDAIVQRIRTELLL
jgi:gluconokinase